MYCAADCCSSRAASISVAFWASSSRNALSIRLVSPGILHRSRCALRRFDRSGCRCWGWWTWTWIWVCCCGCCHLRCWRSASSLLESDLRLLCDRPMEENIVPVIRDRQTRRQLHVLSGESPGRGSIILGRRARAVIIASSLVNLAGGHLCALKVGVWRHCLWLEHRGRRHSMHKRNPEGFQRGGRVRVAQHRNCLYRLVHVLGCGNATTRTVSFIVLTPCRGCPPRRLAER